MNEILQQMYDQHDVVCNQKYGDNLPYSFHLKAVVAQVKRYQNCLPNVDLTHTDQIWNYQKAVRSAAGHDLIEDARMTYNDIKQRWGEEVADIIYACTECRGHNREERHSKEYFNTLKQNRLAVFVKLCDIMANVLFSLLTNSSMYEKYQKEYPRLALELYKQGEYEKLWTDLATFLKV